MVFNQINSQINMMGSVSNPLVKALSKFEEE